MHLNFLAIAVAALVPLLIGFIWYNPKVLGAAWMKEAGLNEESMKGANMMLIFGITLFLSLLLSVSMHTKVVHQLGVDGSLYYALKDPARAEEAQKVKALFDTGGIYANEARTIKHGIIHGVLTGIFFVLPILSINALFERKSWKYIWINTGYWTLCFAIMGAIISVWQ